MANVLAEREGPEGAEEVFMKTGIWQWCITAALSVVTLVSGAADDDPQTVPPPETKPAVTVTLTNAAPAPVIPAKLSLPPLLDQVVRLS